MPPAHTRRLITLGLAVLGTVCSAVSKGDSTLRAFDVQGHRGARGLLPENSLPGFERALELGVSTLELDLGVTRDGVVVVSHDPRINPKICRHADGRSVAAPGPRLRDLDLLEVQAFDCGGLNPDPRRFPEPPRVNLPGTRIPTLSEVFDLAASAGDDKVRFNVEIKHDPTTDDTLPLAAFVERVLDAIQAHRLSRRVTIQCFDWRALEMVRRHAPEQQTAALLAPETLSPLWLGDRDPKAIGGTAVALLETASDLADIFSPHWRQVVPGSPTYLGSTVRELQEAGWSVVPWTVNQRHQMAQLLTLGVDGLITDYPNVLVALLEEKKVPIR